MSESDSTLFGHLPASLFGPLASAPKQHYAKLLLAIYRTFFADALGRAPTQRDVVDVISDEIRRLQLSQADLGEDFAGVDMSHRPRAAYNRLRDSGWLVEHKQGYIVQVEILPEVSVLLASLSQIEQGFARHYGGAIASILSALEAVRNAPLERAQSIADTAQRSREFMRHLRAVIGGLREVERHILAEPSLPNIMRRFFDEFVSTMLIADYKILKTRNNPFRFRDRIVAIASEFLMKEELLDEVAKGYVEQALADDFDSAHEIARGHLEAIRQVFGRVADEIDAIDAFRTRLERRITNTVLYMEMAGGSLVGRISTLLTQLCAEGRDWNSEIVAQTDLVDPVRTWASDQFYRPRSAPRVISRKPIAIQAPDPALLAYNEMKRAYQTRTMINADQVRSYLERHLDGRERVGASDFAIDSLEDLLIFQRLRALPFLHGGLSSDYRLTLLTGPVHDGEWMTCQNFFITRAAHGPVSLEASC